MPGTYISPAETGFYLTGTRYYDPEIGRFINADGEISDVGGNVLGYNLFAYCFNNPVNMDDPTGQWPKWVGKAIAVVAVAAVVVAAVAVTVSTFGAGSVAGVAAISAAVTIAARATEVAVLQVKKSKNSTQNTGEKPVVTIVLMVGIALVVEEATHKRVTDKWLLMLQKLFLITECRLWELHLIQKQEASDLIIY